MEYNIPCGRTVGHGESCVEGWLCHACSTMLKLHEYIIKKGHSRNCEIGNAPCNCGYDEVLKNVKIKYKILK